MNRAKKIELLELLEEKRTRAARGDFLPFTKKVFPQFQVTAFHLIYYQILHLFAVGTIRKLIITVPPQHGKAIEIDTPVLTTKGWKKHIELIPGDYVYGENGAPVRVMENHGAVIHESSQITFTGGETIVASDNHDWKVWCDREKYIGREVEKLCTKKLMDGQRRNPMIPADTVVKSNTRPLPIDPYVLGAWLGDGHSDQGVLTVGAEDIGHFSSLGKAREVRKGIYRVLIPGLSRLLRLNGLIKNKHIPQEYLLSGYSQRMRLLQGIMDTDGSIDKKGRCEFTQKENGLADDVFTLLRSLGIKPTRRKYPMKLNGRVVGTKDRVFFSTTKRVFALPRKLKRLNEKTRADGHNYYILSVDPVGLRHVNCITVVGGLYLVGDAMILTHNSQGSTRLLPSFILGHNPENKVAITSYNTPKAQKFNREVQRIIDSPEYRDVFPDTAINAKHVVTESNYLRNANEFEVINHTGGLKAVGRGGALTGDPVDTLIIDDLYKDYEEGNSPITLEAAWNWYTSVADSRLHNDSQQLIVFTRWNEGDLVGRIEDKEDVITLDGLLEEYDPDKWYKINFEAIKESEPTELDPRGYGEPLWPERHSLKKLERSRSLDSENFNCLYQGNPESKEGYLYKEFRTYKTRPENLLRDNYTDTADTGNDNLCSICYEYSQDIPGDIYVVDVLYTPEPMEITEPATAMLLARNKTTMAYIESNNGGRGFARNVEKELREMKNVSTSIEWFHQGGNKESRIYSNHAQVNSRLIMPYDWEQRWPQFYLAVTKYKKLFSANKNDDGPDTMTGIIEKLDESGVDLFDAV